MRKKSLAVASGNPSSLNSAISITTDTSIFSDSQNPNRDFSIGKSGLNGHEPQEILPITRESEFAWIEVVWREPRQSKQNLSPRFESKNFPQLVESLAEHLIKKGCLQATHLYARFPPVDEIRIIDNRWLAWMLIGKSSGNLWSDRCSLNIERLVWFTPSDIAEGIFGMCWHCAIYISKDRLDSLAHEIHVWEKDNESEIKGF